MQDSSCSMTKFVKGDFTLVPNKAFRDGLAPKLQVILMWLCDFSDENNESFPSRSTLAKKCGISIRSLDDGLNKLEELGLINKENRMIDNEKTSNLYTVNILTPPSAKSAPPSAKNDTTPRAKSAHRTKTNSNSTQLTTSDKSEGVAKVDEYGRSIDINEAFDYWEKTVGYKIQGRVQANRNACSNLLKKFKLSGVQQLINATAVAHNDRYAPRVSDFSTMQSKLNELVAWAKKKGASQNVAKF